jgi:hypothetical protein
MWHRVHARTGNDIDKKVGKKSGWFPTTTSGRGTGVLPDYIEMRLTRFGESTPGLRPTDRIAPPQAPKPAVCGVSGARGVA